jgi:hypothetical protein
MADERRRTVLRQAYEMARSGDFADEQSIEAVLARDDPAASDWLKSPFVREGLRQACDLARAEQRRDKGRSEA